MLATATSPAVAERGPVLCVTFLQLNGPPSPWNLDSIARGKLPAEYLGRRNVIVADRYGTTLLTEGFHFVVDSEDKK